jgi:hypothetical protein
VPNVTGDEGKDPGTSANRGSTEQATQGARATTSDTPSCFPNLKDPFGCVFVTLQYFETIIPPDPYVISLHGAESHPAVTGGFAVVGWSPVA